MASIRKLPSGKFNARITRQGYPVKSKSFITRSDADRWARSIESEMDRGVFVCRSEAEATTLSDALVLTAIEDAHPDIRDYFHSRELGLQLQQLDSLIAAGVMDDMYKSNIVCLPIHDSFIVPAQHEEALRNSMCKWWEYHFKQNPSIDKKY